MKLLPVTCFRGTATTESLQLGNPILLVMPKALTISICSAKKSSFVENGLTSFSLYFNIQAHIFFCLSNLRPFEWNQQKLGNTNANKMKTNGQWNHVVSHAESTATPVIPNMLRVMIYTVKQIKTERSGPGRALADPWKRTEDPGLKLDAEMR